jgi:hypothetical protein
MGLPALVPRDQEPLMTDKAKHIREEIERQLSRLREWRPRERQLERAIITALKNIRDREAAEWGRLVDGDYDGLAREMAEQNERIGKLITAAEVMLKEHSSRMFVDPGRGGQHETSN